MKLTKQSKLLTFQVIVYLITLNTQISFAQNKKINLKDWEGSYIGVGVANSSSKTEIRDVTTTAIEGNSDHFALNNGTKDKSQDEIIFKVGHLEQLNNNILLGIELNKYSDIKTESLNTAAVTDGFDRTRLHLEDILSLDLRVGKVLENEDDFLNNTMVYGKVGIATLRSATRSRETGKSSGAFDHHIGQSKARHYGTVIGLGVEKKLSIFDDPVINKNTSISLEYNMMNFNKKTSGSDSSGAEQTAVGDSQYSVKPEINNLMLTVNYRFSENSLGLKNLIK
jgi:ribosome biogenesis SPOUT family RNA methylase Rps3